MATYWENSCSFGLQYVSWYKYLIVSLVFSHLGFWSGNLFLIAPFPDLCLLVPLCGCQELTYKDLFSIPTFGPKASNRSTYDPLISLLQKKEKPSSKLLRTRLCSKVSQGQRKVII